MDSAGGIEGNERGGGEGAWAQEHSPPGGHHLGRVQSPHHRGCRAAAGDGAAGGKACTQQKPPTRPRRRVKCLPLVTRLFSTMSFAATDIFFKVIKAYLVIKGLGIKLGISCINYL